MRKALQDVFEILKRVTRISGDDDDVGILSRHMPRDRDDRFPITFRSVDM